MKAVIIILSLLAITFVGCSSSNSDLGTTPPVSQARDVVADRNHQVWGLWQFTADPANETLDAVAMRSAEMHLNALPFLEPPSLVNLTIESLQFNGDLIDVNIGLRHPFLGQNEYSGFDVYGVVITDGSSTGFNDPEIAMPGADDTRLLNPDGYTRWWNPVEFPDNGSVFGYTDGLLGAPDSTANFTATLNGYKFFCDDLTNPDGPVSSLTPDNRCVFLAGQKNVRHYSIHLGPAGLVFNYAVDASWAFPTGSPPWNIPDDFPQQANKVEAWNVVVTEVDNTLFNDGATSGGGLSLSINVWDHYNSNINTVWLDSPGNFSFTSSSTPIGGGAGYSTYEINVTNATPAVGSINILIGVESEAVGYQGLLPGKPVTSYFTYSADVSDQGQQIVCGTAVHSYQGQHFINGITGWNYCQRDDLAILEAGAHAGECVIKSFYESDALYTGHYIRFDPDNPSDVAGTDYFTLPGRKPTDVVAAYVTMSPQIDQNPVNAHLGVVNGRMFDTV